MRSKVYAMNLMVLAVLCGAVMQAAAETQPPAPERSAAGALAVPSFALPFSHWASPQAIDVQRDALNNPSPDFGGDIAAARAYYGAFNDARLEEVEALYDYNVAREVWNGVPVDIVTPESGVKKKNAGRVLIAVHGGAFMWGRGSGAIIEAAPIAVTARIKVVAVDYRLAPEHKFPAARDDVVSVYRKLLKHYAAESIGIYGCSAGGLLTAQATAAIIAEGMPKPGAIATLCGTGLPFAGDSVVMEAPIMRGAAPSERTPLPYFDGTSPDDPAVYPLISEEIYQDFPPTLAIAGSRDFAASSLGVAHRRLLATGVRSRFILFDGLGHAFFMYPGLPESEEVFQHISGFFMEELE